jgi:hypothetical protein
MRSLRTENSCHTKSCTHVHQPSTSMGFVPKSLLLKMAISIVALAAIGINSRLVSLLSTSSSSK